jgi:hypothetical protein
MISDLRLRRAYGIAEKLVAVRFLSAAILLVFLAALTACNSVQSVAPATSTQQSSPRILLSPTRASVSSGGTLQFTAAIQNSSDTAVRWSATAGTISASGLFHAPTVSSVQTIDVIAASAQTVIGERGHSDLPELLATTSLSVTPIESLSISTRELPASTTSVSYSAALNSSGGTPPYAWSISSGALPQGMQLNASGGFISGSSSHLGTFPFTVSVSDASSNRVAQALTLTVSNSTSGDGQGALCGPPAYRCAVSVSPTSVVQLPAKLPRWTASTGPMAGNPLYGAGVSASTSEFGKPVTIFRLTDMSNNCSPTASSDYASAQVSNGGSGDETHFNTNSTLVVLGSLGGWICPEAVNATGGHLSFSRIDNNFYFPSTTDSVIPSYDSSTPDVLYALSTTQIQTYDFTGYSPSSAPPVPTTNYDFASTNCLLRTANPYKVTWATHLSSAKYPADSMFGTAFSNAGNQNSGFDVVAYKPGAGCSHFNTKTGVITGDWGATGSIAIPDRFLVHNALLSKDGTWMVISWETCIASCSAANNTIEYFWQVGTTNVLVSCSSTIGGQCGGHFTEGAQTFINFGGSESYQEESRSFAGAPNLPTPLKTGIAACSGTGYGVHQGWPNVDPADSYPYIETTVSNETGQPRSAFTCPFLNEVDLVDPAGLTSSAQGSGTVYREAHTFNSGHQTDRFSCQYAIGSISTDGTIAIWETDGMGAFGSTSGGSSCSGTSCRCEVVGMLLQ